MLNKHQPIRPRINPDKEQLLRYRTFPDMSNTRMIKFCNPHNMIAQARMYRFVRSGEMVNHIAISEMYDYLFYDTPMISKKQMGMLVIQTTIYNPRVLLGLSKINDKNRVIYRFASLLEFQYGLEWMICTWLRKFLNDTAAPGAAPVLGPDMMSDELDILANCPDEEYKDVYEEMLRDFKMEEPDWATLVSGQVEELPVIEAAPIVAKRPQPPRSLISASKPS